jgi:hypothetical protein
MGRFHIELLGFENKVFFVLKKAQAKLKWDV